MIFPKINNIYEYNDKLYVVWQQTLFKEVYLRTIPKSGGASFLKAKWFDFMLNAKFIKPLPKLSSAY